MVSTVEMAYCTSSYVAPWLGRSHLGSDIKNAYYHSKAAHHKIDSPPGTGSLGCDVNASLYSQVKSTTELLTAGENVWE